MSQNKGSKYLFYLRSIGHLWSLHEVEVREKNQKGKGSWREEEVTVEEERQGSVEDRCLAFQVRPNLIYRRRRGGRGVRAGGVRVGIRGRRQDGGENVRKQRVNNRGAISRARRRMSDCVNHQVVYLYLFNSLIAFEFRFIIILSYEKVWVCFKRPSSRLCFGRLLPLCCSCGRLLSCSRICTNCILLRLSRNTPQILSRMTVL